jgi:hypothetical protein
MQKIRRSSSTKNTAILANAKHTAIFANEKKWLFATSKSLGCALQANELTIPSMTHAYWFHCV